MVFQNSLIHLKISVIPSNLLFPFLKLTVPVPVMGGILPYTVHSAVSDNLPIANVQEEMMRKSIYGI